MDYPPQQHVCRLGMDHTAHFRGAQPDVQNVGDEWGIEGVKKIEKCPGVAIRRRNIEKVSRKEAQSEYPSGYWIGHRGREGHHLNQVL